MLTYLLKHPAPNPAPWLRPASAPCLLPGVLLLLLCSCCPLVCSPFSLLTRCPAMHKRTSEPKMKSVQQRTQGRQSGYTHLADRSPCCCELACRSFTARSLLRLAARLSVVVHAQEQQQLRQIAQSRPRCRAEQAAMSDPREPTHATRTNRMEFGQCAGPARAMHGLHCAGNAHDNEIDDNGTTFRDVPCGLAPSRRCCNREVG